VVVSRIFLNFLHVPAGGAWINSKGGAVCCTDDVKTYTSTFENNFAVQVNKRVVRVVVFVNFIWLDAA
jgi:hypothetical protein